MPPKAKLSDEKKEELWNNWKESEEYKKIQKVQQEHDALPVKPIEVSWVDLSFPLQAFLNALFDLVQELKVPGRKAKSYDQMYVRTMFFERQLQIIIDGATYDVSNGAIVDIYGCKSCITDIVTQLDDKNMEMTASIENWTGFRKDLIKALKDWDAKYLKHIKNTYPEINEIHKKAMKPILTLLDANRNFYLLEQMIEKEKEKGKQEVPDFRFIALEEEFVKHFTNVCKIFQDHGTLTEPFDIRQMINTLKIKDWKNIPAFKHYNQPLDDAVKAVREKMLKMHQDGPLFIAYVLEKNVELETLIKQMVTQDGLTQWLLGNELRQDQIKYFYEYLTTIYNSCLRDKLLNEEEELVKYVIPQLIVFKTLMKMRNIQLTKYHEERHEREKQERKKKRMEEEGIDTADTDPNHLTEEQIYAKKVEKEEAGTTNMTDKEVAALTEKKEREKYGRFWLWENFSNPLNEPKWLENAERLKHVNDHVIQDIEDYILLQSFKNMKQHEIQAEIEQDWKERTRKTKKMKGKDADEWEKKQLEDHQKRKFLNEIRPPYYWNFFEDVHPDLRVEHVLRHNANPKESYKDKRVEKILEAIEELAMGLTKFEEVNFKRLTESAIKIFKDEDALAKKKEQELS